MLNLEGSCSLRNQCVMAVYHSDDSIEKVRVFFAPTVEKCVAGVKLLMPNLLGYAG
jgi:hypothetical protein